MDAWVKKVGTHRGKPRFFLDGVQAIRSGFSPGESFDVEVDGQRVSLIKKDDGSRVVSSRERNGKVSPVIDINSAELLQMFEGMESIRVVVTTGAVYLLPMASEVKRVKRLSRLREKLQESQPLLTGSISHGGGVLAHAIHQGLRDGGVESNLAMAVEIREDLLIQAIEHNDAWDDSTMALALPMQELVQDDYLMAKLPAIDLLDLALPCSGASVAGRARKGLSMPEEHEHVGHLVASAIAIINRVQPTAIVFENVVTWSTSASAAILRSTLRDMGYDTYEAVLSGRDFGCIEDRVRWTLVAMTRGMEFDMSEIRPPQVQLGTLQEHLDPSIQPDSPIWRSVQYLKDKRERDEAKGNGFKNQFVEADTDKIGTLRKGYSKGGSPDPRLRHPSDPELSRLLTAQEHASVKGVPEQLIDGLSQTNAHQLLGQGIVYEPFRAVAQRIAECMRRFATPASMRAAIAEVVGCGPQELRENVGGIMVLADSAAELPAAALASMADSRVQAWHDTVTNTTVFLSDRIVSGAERAVFLHEVVHRHGRNALPDGQWDCLVDQVKSWAGAEPQTRERVIHDRASARVATVGVGGAAADEELFAYAVEEAVLAGIEPTAAAAAGSAEAWLAAVVQSIQRVGEKLIGNGLDGLDGQDLVDLAYGLAQLERPENMVVIQRAFAELASVRRLEREVAAAPAWDRNDFQMAP